MAKAAQVRTDKVVTLFVSPELFTQIEKARTQRTIPVTRTALIKHFIKEGLKRDKEWGAPETATAAE